MPDDSVEILVKMAADTSGGKEARKELDGVKGATEETGKATERANTHLQGMHKLFHALNEVVPGLGVAMQAAFSPIGAAISLALMALRLFHEKMKEFNEECRKAAEEAAKPLTNRLEQQRETVTRSAEGLEHLRERLADAARSEVSLRESMEKTISAFKEQAQEAESLALAMKENELAESKRAYAAGLLSAEEYAVRRLAIEEEYLEKKRKLVQREEMSEILIRQRAGDLAEAKQPELTGAATEAERKKEKALENLGSYDKAGINERYKETQKKLKEFEEGHNEEVGWFEQAGGPHATRASLYETMAKVGRVTYKTENFDAWQKLKWDADNAAKDWKKAPGEEARLKVAAEGASHDAERAAKEAEDNQRFTTKNSEDISERRARYNARAQTNRELSGVERDTLGRQQEAAVLGSKEGKLVKDVAEAESILQHGGQISLGQQAEIKTLASKMQHAHMQNSDAILRALGMTVANTEALTAQIVKLSHRLNQQNKQIKNAGSP
jgi:hypothetical protein